MRQNPYKGKFIVFEGLDGSGSSTQAGLLSHKLKKNNKETKDVQLTREPSDSLIGGLIRSNIRGDWESSTNCLQLLFSADRAYHLEKQVIPCLKEGITVISDRYFLSTIAYGTVETDQYKWFKELNRHFILPDLTILIDTEPKECLERIQVSRPHTELYEKEKTLTEARKVYQKLAKEFEDIKTINGNRAKNKVFEDVKETVDSIGINV